MRAHPDRNSQGEFWVQRWSWDHAHSKYFLVALLAWHCVRLPCKSQEQGWQGPQPAVTTEQGPRPHLGGGFYQVESSRGTPIQKCQYLKRCIAGNWLMPLWAAWQIGNLKAGRQEGQAGIHVHRQDFFFLRETSVLFLRSFNWLDETHTNYPGKSPLPLVNGL